MQRIKKAIFPIAGISSRFLPLSKVIGKEFFPLVDKPMIQYLIEEALDSGIEKIIFVLRPGKKEVIDYFKKDEKLERKLKETKRNHLLKELKKLQEISKKLSFSFVYQQKPRGDGHAILQAKKYVKEEPFAVFFGDDIVYSKIPCLLQLYNLFKTAQRETIALKRVTKEFVFQYGIVKVEKIADSFFKIKDIVEKPSLEKAPSDLAIVGRYILTPEIFYYLEKLKPSKRKEIILADALKEMVRDGKTVYGYEIKGKWLECGDILRWLKSNIYLSLRHSEFASEIKKFLKENE